MAQADRSFEQVQRRLRLVERIGEADWHAIRRAYPGDAFDDWTDQLDRLIDAGLRAGAIRQFAHATPRCARIHGPETVGALSSLALVIKRQAGDGAATALFRAAPEAARLAGPASAFRAWLAAIEEVAVNAPESVGAVLERTELVLGTLDLPGFDGWVRTCIRAADGDPSRRLLNFSIADAEALELIQQEAGNATFADFEQRIRYFLAALWGVLPVIRSAPPAGALRPLRRATFDEFLVRLPSTFPGFSSSQTARLFHAAIAHVGAHIMFTPQRFSVGSLKPVQVALASLIEDARVEALAMAELAGLRRLWMPFHVVDPQGTTVAPALMARLSRALIDQTYRDPDRWVTKGRELFHDQRSRWDDPGLSRRIGSLLGNDLGQMRVQFNAKTYVVQPPYRDDNAGIWDFGEPPAAPSSEAETITQSIRIERTENPTEPQRRERAEAAETEARRAARLSQIDDDTGIAVARLPEWDYTAGRERRDWTTVLEFKPRTGPPEIVDRIMVEYRDVAARIGRLISSARVSRPVRVRRQPEGDRLDLAACIDARIAWRIGMTPDPRVYESSILRHRDLSVLLLLDISESTKDTIKGTATSVFHIERAATALLASAMAGVGDPFAIGAFCSDTRHEVRYYRIKDFDEAFDDAAKSRLVGLRGGYSTRIGAAIRFAGRELGERLSHRRLLLIVTDGEPSDVDVTDRAYLVEDARHAVQTLAHRGIDVFCVGLESGGDSYLDRIFGRRNVLLIDRVAALPERLPMLYFRLTH
jgi:nitric oxide reductase NorD protein